MKWYRKMQWFNGDKGYGFITDDQGRGRYLRSVSPGINGSGYKSLEEARGFQLSVENDARSNKSRAVNVP